MLLQSASLGIAKTRHDRILQPRAGYYFGGDGDYHMGGCGRIVLKLYSRYEPTGRLVAS